MSELPPIPNDNPIIIPAQEYRNAYIVDFHFDGIGFSATFRPYNYELKTFYPGSDKDWVEKIDNIWQIADQHPLIASTIGSLITGLLYESALKKVDAGLVQLAAAIQYANARLANLDARISNGDDETPMEELLADKAAVEASLTPLNEQLTTLTAQRQQILVGLGVQ